MSAEFNCTKRPTARRPHTCQECGRTIGPGETYERTAAIWEGDFFTCVACAHCAAARRIVDNVDGHYSETYYHGLRPWLSEMAGEYDLDKGIFRLWAQMRADWRYQSGALMPVPEAVTA